MKNRAQEIVKVQVPINTMEGPLLIYNRDKSIMTQVFDTELLGYMEGKPKKFFYAKIRGAGFEIIGEAPWQEW